MKATKYISLAALALMGTLASCQSDDEAADLSARPANAVTVNFSVGSLQGTTRSNAAATDAEAQRQFNTADQVCVSTDGQDPVTYQYDGEKWNEATAGKFLVWTADQQNFQAYYPATTGTSMTTFTVPTDQSSVEKIALADYMTRQRNVSKGNEVQMQLERKMARVIIRISGFGSQYRDDEKTVSNVRIYSESSGIADGNGTGSSTEINPYVQGDGGLNTTYTALVVPGYGDSGARFIQLSDGEWSTLLVKGIPEMEAGYSYTFNLMVGKDKIEVTSVTVQDWATGETLTGGQAEEEQQEQAVTAATPLTMECLTDGTIVVNIDGELETGMQYAVNGGEKTTITTTTTIEDLKAGDKVQFYGVGTDTQDYGNNVEVTISGGTAQVKVYGNIMSLLDETGFANKTDLPNSNYVFYGLFYGNENLTDASGLLLPATVLAECCYADMFNGCSSLTAAPALPATTLADYCYVDMFNGCSSLTAAPELPATTLADYCYSAMFFDCSKLASVTCKATDITAMGCLDNWLQYAGESVTSPTLYVTDTSKDWNNGNFTVKALPGK